MRLLIIGADHASNTWLGERLINCGFDPEYAEATRKILNRSHVDRVQAIIVDPPRNQSPAQCIRRFRDAGIDTPLIVLISRMDWRESVELLDAGADDILVKPARSDVVAARLRAILRRSAGSARDEFNHGDLRLDIRVRRAWLEDSPLNLTGNEFRLLRLFVLNCDRFLTHREIHRKLYPDRTEISPNAIEVQITRLRRKIGSSRIQTIRRLGYRLLALKGQERAA